MGGMDPKSMLIPALGIGGMAAMPALFPGLAATGALGGASTAAAMTGPELLLGGALTPGMMTPLAGGGVAGTTFGSGLSALGNKLSPAMDMMQAMGGGQDQLQPQQMPQQAPEPFMSQPPGQLESFKDIASQSLPQIGSTPQYSPEQLAQIAAMLRRPTGIPSGMGTQTMTQLS